MQAEPPESSFLRGNNVYSSYTDATAVILQAPYEETASYGKGTAGGPAAIVQASEFLELYDIPSRSKPSDIGIATLPPIAMECSPEQAVALVEEQVAAVLRDGKKPVLIGGEHSLTIGAVRAVHKSSPDVGVLQLDAHADLRAQYEGTPLSHACAMRRVADLGVPHVGVGIRSMSEEEARFVEENGILLVGPDFETRCGGGPPRSMGLRPETRCGGGPPRSMGLRPETRCGGDPPRSMGLRPETRCGGGPPRSMGLRPETRCGGDPPRSMGRRHGERQASAASAPSVGARPRSEAMEEAIETLPAAVYVSIDIDVLDPSCMPATGAPEPGGLAWGELTAALQALADTGKEIVGFDVMELAPIAGLHFCDYTAARLVYRMIGMFWG